MDAMQKTKVYLKDYKKPDFEIAEVNLTFNLGDEFTTVENEMTIVRGSKDENKPLVLNGEDLILQSVYLDDQLLSHYDYELTSNDLTIKRVPGRFILKVVTQIQPQLNTQFSGLYKSNQIFCTQCEAEGFRRITYYMDRPDILSRFTTKIIADKTQYPFMLSNGDCVEQGDLDSNRHYTLWRDPFPKPCYLFALVAGNLDVRRDHWITASGRKVDIEIYVDKGNLPKTTFAMQAIKKAMQWDEETFGREYDLNRFMIVAINDFNMGAMENKGLNIFNTLYVLASDETATDKDYENILSVVGHEYFHNWTGNRVTCRDWFQLSLKEGLTIYRDQEFSSDMLSRTVNRIQQVDFLRSYQFPQDAGPMAHSVRPESYLQIDNFYTVTVYEKGAEVIRMIETWVGKTGFRKGLDLYFQRHDGQAVTIEDFVKAMEEANQIDLSQFRLWYSQVGTPTIEVATQYDVVGKRYSITLKQRHKVSSQPALLIPMRLSLFDSAGQVLEFENQGFKGYEQILKLSKAEQTFVFEGIPSQPIPSLLRNFSAPVKLKYDYSENELLTLILHETDGFMKWESTQQFYLLEFNRLLNAYQQKQALVVNKDFSNALKIILSKTHTDLAFMAEMLSFPSKKFLSTTMEVIDIEGIYHVENAIHEQLAQFLEEILLNNYLKLNERKKPYQFDLQSVGERAFKNVCLAYLMYLKKPDYIQLAKQQFNEADNMTDRYEALRYLANFNCQETYEALDNFYQTYQNDTLVIDKWFRVQALAEHDTVFEHVKQLSKHVDFSIHNPNRFRALVGAFCQNNFYYFHRKDGLAYEFLGNNIIQVNDLNPQIAARAVEPLIRWRSHDAVRSQHMRKVLEHLLNHRNLSSDVFEIVENSLKNEV